MAGAATTLDESGHKLNLSYVLHEASTSRAVHRAWRDSLRFQRQKLRLLHHFRALSDEDFGASLVVPPDLLKIIKSLEAPPHLLTVSVGLPELLPHAIGLHCPIAAGPGFVTNTLVDASVSPPESTYVHFFRAPASVPDFQTGSGSNALIVAGIVVRPGARSLMLTGDVLQPAESREAKQWPYTPSTLATLERIIRDYVDQWTPSRRLWEVPAEVGLTEFQTRERSA